MASTDSCSHFAHRLVLSLSLSFCVSRCRRCAEGYKGQRCENKDIYNLGSESRFLFSHWSAAFRRAGRTARRGRRPRRHRRRHRRRRRRRTTHSVAVVVVVFVVVVVVVVVVVCRLRISFPNRCSLIGCPLPRSHNPPPPPTYPSPSTVSSPAFLLAWDDYRITELFYRVSFVFQQKKTKNKRETNGGQPPPPPLRVGSTRAREEEGLGRGGGGTLMTSSSKKISGRPPHARAPPPVDVLFFLNFFRPKPRPPPLSRRCPIFFF